MCVIINHTNNNSLDDEFLIRIYDKNKDGLGVMYAERGKIHVHKIIPKGPEEVIEFYKEHADIKDCVIHFRRRTVGEISLANTHPFYVENGLYYAHNGDMPFEDSIRSDSKIFAEDFLRPILKNGNSYLIFDKNWADLLGRIIGSHNKLIFLNNEGKVTIINEKEGHYVNGAWFSSLEF